MKTPLQLLIEFIASLVHDGFWGSVTISFERGVVKHIEQKKSVKLVE
jgi:hypothetical protein